MKLKQGLVLGNIAGEYVVLPSGDDMDLTTMTTLNDTGKFIWECLETETTQEQVVDKIMEVYEDISREEAAHHVANFVAKLESYGYLEA